MTPHLTSISPSSHSFLNRLKFLHNVPSFTLSFLAACAVAAVSTSSSKLRTRDSWGGALSLDPTTSRIVTAQTILIPGAAPPTQNGELFLWPGMSNGTGDLIQ